MEHQVYTEIGDFEDQFQADLAREILESNGINCLISGQSEDMLDFNNLTRVRLRISKQDETNSLEILRVFFPGIDIRK